MPSVDANAWNTLAEIQEELQISISETDHNDYLINLINRSYKILEAYIGQQIKSKSYTEHYSGDSTGKLLLKNRPINSITSIHEDVERVFGSDRLIDSGNYTFDANSGLVEIFQHDGTGPSWFESGVRNIKVIYNAGYDTIPNDLKEAGCKFVAWLFRRSNTAGTVRVSLGGHSEEFDGEKIPKFIKFWLDPYKNIQV